MGIPILLTGRSGTGKSTSLRNFGEEEVLLINVLNKPLPFKAKFKYVLNTDSHEKIKAALSKMPTKTAIIDDARYLITNAFMKNHTTNAGYNLYNTIADQFWSLIEFIKTLPEDVTVYFIMHEDKNEMGDIKPKTLGKLLDEKVCIEGMFTIALRCVISNGKHLFKTNSDSYDVCKSPLGMFSEMEIDNDLKMVDKTIREYYEI